MDTNEQIVAIVRQRLLLANDILQRCRAMPGMRTTQLKAVEQLDREIMRLGERLEHEVLLKDHPVMIRLRELTVEEDSLRGQHESTIADRGRIGSERSRLSHDLTVEKQRWSSAPPSSKLQGILAEAERFFDRVSDSEMEWRRASSQAEERTPARHTGQATHADSPLLVGAPPPMNKPLLVLHLSDLHFGPHGRFAGQDMRTLASRFHQAVDHARAELNFEEKVGLMIVTGDIAEAARPKEYEQAAAFFGALTSAMELARRYVVFVPGNHDVSWVDTKKVALDQQDESFDDVELNRRMDEVKLRKYESFVAAFHGNDPMRFVQPIGHGAHIVTYPDLDVSVAALNSCEHESHLRQGGFLSQSQAQVLMEHWRGDEYERRIKIVSIHHNPVATVPANVASWVEYLRTKRDTLKGDVFEHFAADATGFEGRTWLRNVAQDCKVQLVLHGHHHARDTTAWNWHGRAKGQTQVLSSGSWGLLPDRLPEGQPAMMHLVRLDPVREEIRSVLRIYEPRARIEGVVQPGTFAVDPSDPEGATLHLSVPEGIKKTKAADALPHTASVHIPASQLFALGPSIIAQGARVAVSGNRWKLRLDRFWLGNESSLSKFCEDIEHIPRHNRYIVLTDLGEGRVVSGPAEWSSDTDRIHLHVSVEPEPCKTSAAAIEDLDDNLNKVRGFEAAAIRVQRTLATALGELFYAPNFGSLIGDWLEAGCTLPLEALLRIDAVRFLYIATDDKQGPPLAFVERIHSILPTSSDNCPYLDAHKNSDRDEVRTHFEIEVAFVGGHRWKGPVCIPLYSSAVVRRKRERIEKELHLRISQDLIRPTK